MRHAAFVVLSLLQPVAAIQTTRQASFNVSRELEDPRVIRHNIPLQLVMTAKEGSIDDLPPPLRDNVRRTLALNPELRPRFLNDETCRVFIAANFGAELQAAFAGERVGAFRGDLCRAAVLAVEGGFYADLDLQPRVPFEDLVDNTTTFMTAYSASFCDILNALIAVERGSTVMHSVLEEIKAWYAGGNNEGKLMGTFTMMQGLDNVVATDCPGVSIRRRDQLRFKCGEHHNFRLYREEQLRCKYPSPEECPAVRFHSKFHWVKYGIFEPGAAKVHGMSGRNLVAWSRFENCTDFGCREQGEEKSNQRRGRQGWCKSERPVTDK